MKPIAYIDHVSGKPKLIDGYVVQTDYDIPLYTTPQTKPLSDEEIADMVCSGEYWKVDGLTIISVDFAKFARAIEERHGIK